MPAPTSPGAAANDLLNRADRWLENVPLNDTWHIHAETNTVAHLRTSAYVDEELHFLAPDGAVEDSGLSGDAIDARPGHRITVVRLTARNSGRRRPVVLYDHDNGNVQILSGNFAPLLRSRYEGLVLLAGLLAASVLITAGVWLKKTLPIKRRKDPSLFFFITGAAMVPLGIVFTDKRRRRLRRDLEQACDAIAAQLRQNGTLKDGEIAVTPAADETPRP